MFNGSEFVFANCCAISLMFCFNFFCFEQASERLIFPMCLYCNFCVFSLLILV